MVGPSGDLDHWRRIGDTLDGIQVAMCLFDPDDRCLAWNRTFLALFPEHDGQVSVGEPYRENLRRFYLSRLAPAEWPHLERHIDAGVARHRVQREPFVFEHRGRQIEASSLPLGEQGRLRVWRTDRASLRPDAPPPLNLNAPAGQGPAAAGELLDRVPEGLMVCGPDGVIQWVNEPFARLYGLPSRAVPLGTTFETVLRLAWSQEPAGPQGSLHDNLVLLRDQLLFAGAPFELTLPNERVVRVLARPGHDGTTFFAHIDISELRQQQRRLAQAEQAARASEAALRHKSTLLEATLENMDQGVAMISPTGVVELFNRRAIELLELPLEHLGSRPTLKEVVQFQAERGEFGPQFQPLPMHMGDNIQTTQRQSYQRRRPNGRVLEIQTAALRDGGMLRTYTDVTERLAADAQIRYAASHDGLTGLMNRNTFLECLNAEVAHSLRSGEGCAVLYLDLDGFKPINDQHGHAVGDEALNWAAQQIREAARESDFVARLGGDEFAVLQRNVQDDAQIQVLVDRLRQAIHTPFELHGLPLQMGVSIGVAVCPRDGAASEALLQHADQAMYRAKASKPPAPR